MKKILIILMMFTVTNSFAMIDTHDHVQKGVYKPNVKFSGYIEVISEFINNYSAPSTSDVYLSEASFSGISNLSSKISAEIEFFHSDSNQDLKMDKGFLTYKASESFKVEAGRYQLPFGKYETSLVYSTFSKGIGKTQQAAVGASYTKGIFTFSGYIFNGERDTNTRPNRIDSYGGEVHVEKGNVMVALGYINNLNDSVRLLDKVSTNRKYVDASVLSVRYKFGDGFKLFGEYISSYSRFNPADLSYKNNGAKISAFHTEFSLTRELLGKETVFALGFQQTAESINLALSKRRFSIGGSRELVKNTTLYLEYYLDSDYGLSEGGTDKNASSIAGLFGYDF